MQNLGRLALKQIFLDAFYLKKGKQIKASALHEFMRMSDYQQIKSLMQEMELDKVVSISDPDEHDYTVQITDYGMTVKETGGYAENYRKMDFEMSKIIESQSLVKPTEDNKSQMNLYHIYKHELIEFYKRNRRFDFYQIDPSELNITDKQEAFFYRLWRNKMKEELIKKGNLICNNPYYPNILEYVKSQKEINYDKRNFIAAVVGIIVAIILGLLALIDKK